MTANGGLLPSKSQLSFVIMRQFGVGLQDPCCCQPGPQNHAFHSKWMRKIGPVSTAANSDSMTKPYHLLLIELPWCLDSTTNNDNLLLAWNGIISLCNLEWHGVNGPIFCSKVRGKITCQHDDHLQLPVTWTGTTILQSCHPNSMLI